MKGPGRLFLAVEFGCDVEIINTVPDRRSCAGARRIAVYGVGAVGFNAGQHSPETKHIFTSMEEKDGL
jgi:hypothetical protein